MEWAYPRKKRTKIYYEKLQQLSFDNDIGDMQCLSPTVELGNVSSSVSNTMCDNLSTASDTETAASTNCFQKLHCLADMACEVQSPPSKKRKEDIPCNDICEVQSPPSIKRKAATTCEDLRGTQSPVLSKRMDVTVGPAEVVKLRHLSGNSLFGSSSFNTLRSWSRTSDVDGSIVTFEPKEKHHYKQAKILASRRNRRKNYLNNQKLPVATPLADKKRTSIKRCHSGPIRIQQNARKVLMQMGRGCLKEKIIREVQGNNPETSKTLRFLLNSKKISRSGGGGRKDPYVYQVTSAGLEYLEEIASNIGVNLDESVSKEVNQNVNETMTWDPSLKMSMSKSVEYSDTAVAASQDEQVTQQSATGGNISTPITPFT